MAGTVTVACKMPHGLILRTHRWVTRQQPVMGGGIQEFKQAEPTGVEVKIEGYLKPNTENQVQASRMPAFVLTHGVDADFWEEWVNQNSDHEALKNGLLYAHEKQEHAAGHAKEYAKKPNGLEPMDMSMVQKGDRRVAKDARVPRTMVPGAATPIEIGEGSTSPN